MSLEVLVDFFSETDENTLKRGFKSRCSRLATAAVTAFNGSSPFSANLEEERLSPSPTPRIQELFESSPEVVDLMAVKRRTVENDQHAETVARRPLKEDCFAVEELALDSLHLGLELLV